MPQGRPAPALDPSSRAVGPSGPETAFFFGDAGRRKYAVLHEPSRGRAPGWPILLLHPHFEEKLWAQRIFVEAASTACDRGHRVLRFDFTGHGDSEREFEDVSFAELEADADEGAALLEKRDGRPPVLVGLRLGATLAGRAAARRGLATVLWEPVLDIEEWLHQALRANLTFQLLKHGKVRKNRNALVRELDEGGTVLIEGYGLTSAFYREAIASGGLGEPAFPGACERLLAVGIRRAVPAAPTPLEEAVRGWAESVPAEPALVLEQPFWTDVRRYRTRSEELVRRTLDWIDNRASAQEVP